MPMKPEEFDVYIQKIEDKRQKIAGSSQLSGNELAAFNTYVDAHKQAIELAQAGNEQGAQMLKQQYNNQHYWQIDNAATAGNVSASRIRSAISNFNSEMSGGIFDNLLSNFVRPENPKKNENFFQRLKPEGLIGGGIGGLLGFIVPSMLGMPIWLSALTAIAGVFLGGAGGNHFFGNKGASAAGAAAGGAKPPAPGGPAPQPQLGAPQQSYGMPMPPQPGFGPPMNPALAAAASGGFMPGAQIMGTGWQKPTFGWDMRPDGRTFQAAVLPNLHPVQAWQYGVPAPFVYPSQAQPYFEGAPPPDLYPGVPSYYNLGYFGPPAPITQEIPVGVPVPVPAYNPDLQTVPGQGAAPPTPPGKPQTPSSKNK